MSIGREWTAANHKKAEAVTPLPMTSAILEPNRRANRPACDPSTPINSAEGSRYSPESTTEAPKPKPVLFASCANSGKMMNDEYIPAPSRNAVRLVVHTPRIRIIDMSISGSRLCTSTYIQAAMIRKPKSNSASVLGEPQPQVVV